MREASAKRHHTRPGEVAGSFARTSVCWPPETCPCCRWFRAGRRRGRSPRAEAVKAQRTPGEGTTARAATTPGGGTSRVGNDKTLSCSCPAEKRKNFVSRAADHSAALRGPFRPKSKRTRLCRVGWTELLVAAASLPPARWWADPPKAQTPRLVVTGRG